MSEPNGKTAAAVIAVVLGAVTGGGVSYGVNSEAEKRLRDTESDVKVFRNEVGHLKEDIADMKKDVGENSDKLEAVDRRSIRIENDVNRIAEALGVNVE